MTIETSQYSEPGSTTWLNNVFQLTQSIGEPVLRKALRGFSYIQNSGKVLSSIGVFCLIIGSIFSWSELIFIGTSCIVMMLAAVCFLFGRAELKVHIELSPTKVVVGAKSAASIEVVNSSHKKLIPLRIELPVGTRLIAFDLPALAPNESTEEIVVLSTSKRGVIPVGPVKSVRSDPLGLLKREVSWVKASEVIVHPKTVTVTSVGAGIIRDLEGQETRQLSASDVAFHTLREYVPGDDRRFVHWKTSARLDKLMVRQFVDTRRSQVGIVLGGAADEYADDDEYELAVSVFGSIGRRIIGDSQSLAAVGNGKVIRSGSPTILLDGLSRLNFPSKEGTLHESVSVLSKTTKDLGLVFFVFGSTFDAMMIHKLGLRLGIGCTLIGIQVGVERSGVKTIGSLKLISLHNLNELFGILRAAL